MKNYSLSIPKLVEFQAQLNRLLPNSDVVIAGGCLRDILHDREVTDIDVYIYDEGCRDDLQAVADHLRSEVECLPGTQKDYSSFSVLNLPEGFRMYPMQLIQLLEHPVAKIKRDFDFGLCQVWLDRGKLQMTSDYWRDHDTNTFHFRPIVDADYQRFTSVERIKKLQAKYPGWKFKGVDKSLREIVAPTEPVGGLEFVL